MTPPIIIGLTGGICSGKSTVSKTIQEYNIPIVDADIVARQVVELDKPAWKLIVSTFGTKYLNEDKTINRTKLGNLVFSNKEYLIALNNIMKPLLAKEAESQFEKLTLDGHNIFVWDAALIIEMGNYEKYRPLIVVHCQRDTQISRLMKRNSLTEEEAVARVDAQLPVEQKIKYADYVIDTNGSIEQSIQQTKIILNKIISI